MINSIYCRTGAEMQSAHDAAIKRTKERDAEYERARIERNLRDAERHAFERTVHECRPTPEDIERNKRFMAAWDRDYRESEARGWSTE